MSLGQTIRSRRKELKLDQWELAKKLGVPQSCISDWEADETRPRRDRLRTIAKILKVPYSRIAAEFAA